MPGDFGIKITVPGSDVYNAKTQYVSLDTTKPMFKIDTQTGKGFISLTLIIVTDPPEPVGPATDKYTVLYQFAHTYKYVPSLESLFYVTTPPPGAAFTQTYFQDFGQVGAHTVADAVYLFAVADNTNVYIICDKYNAGGGLANLLTGTNVDITLHTFVDDIGV